MDIKQNRVIVVLEDCATKDVLGVITWKAPNGQIMITDSLKGVFPGEYIFKLKDTMGLPLDFSVSNVLSRGYVIDWVSYIEEARNQFRWDYQTFEDLKYLRSELSEYRDYFDDVIKRFKCYVVKNVHPML